ncbi:hypothetical protein MLD38_024510 [Melastoma candidum]|uniref:Uncharacterized protein n=1 Tax=Melastoma candidum TaxID=119954 RepID=A0ACB9NXL1_9MYRT|nr:hypothetical protein MLD38_024510 [Melastoma candidum]
MSPVSYDIVLSGHRISDWARRLKLYVSGLWSPSKAADTVPSRSPAIFRKRADEGPVVSVSYEDAEVVIQLLGIRAGEQRLGQHEEEEAAMSTSASTEEMREAFGVFDADGDGYIGAVELQRVLCALGYKEGKDLRDCERMIGAYDDNCDGRIDFEEFVKFVGITDCPPMLTSISSHNSS